MSSTYGDFAKDERVTFHQRLTSVDVGALSRNSNLRVLQCSEPVETGTWEMLNEQFFPQRPDVELRVFGFYSLVCDLSFTMSMSNVRRFSADCLYKADNVEAVAEMERLESLSVGIYNLRDFNFLKNVSPGLKVLFLGGTKSKQPDLTPVARFHSLEKISLDGQQKNIEILSDLSELREVTLRSISTGDLNWLQPLNKMWSLDINLGGVTDLSAIENIGSIKYLELWRVRGLSDISVISSLTGLEYLSLQTLSRITTLPPLHNLHKLRRISLDTMKCLGDITSLESAPALEEFTHFCAENFEPEDFLPVLRNKTLQQALIGFGSDRKNNWFKLLMQQHGIEPWNRSAFQFSA